MILNLFLFEVCHNHRFVLTQINFIWHHALNRVCVMLHPRLQDSRRPWITLIFCFIKDLLKLFFSSNQNDKKVQKDSVVEDVIIYPRCSTFPTLTFSSTSAVLQQFIEYIYIFFFWHWSWVMWPQTGACMMSRWTWSFILSTKSWSLNQLTH